MTKVPETYIKHIYSEYFRKGIGTLLEEKYETKPFALPVSKCLIQTIYRTNIYYLDITCFQRLLKIPLFCICYQYDNMLVNSWKDNSNDKYPNASQKLKGFQSESCKILNGSIQVDLEFLYSICESI